MLSVVLFAEEYHPEKTRYPIPPTVISIAAIKTVIRSLLIDILFLCSFIESYLSKYP